MSTRIITTDITTTTTHGDPVRIIWALDNGHRYEIGRVTGMGGYYGWTAIGGAKGDAKQLKKAVAAIAETAR